MAVNYNYFPNLNNTTGTPDNLFNRSVSPVQTQQLYQTPTQYQSVQPTQQPLFPQSQGNVFFINTSSEIQNIPITNGISAAICLSENILYLKTFQNGSPAIVAYRLSAFESIASQEPKTENSLTTLIQNFESRLKKLEESNTKKGGKLNELI